jgi:phage tail protein X
MFSRTLTSSRPVQHVSLSLLVLLGGLWVCGTRAAEPTASTNAAPAAAYVVKKGDTLDKLLTTYYKGSPLKPEVLRSAVMAANPALSGKKPALKPGSQLVLPEHGQIMWATLAPYVPEQVLAAQASASIPDTTARRDWVRYP